MAENSAISWTRHTWNPWMGCTKLSPACDGCYAETLMDKRYGKVRWGNHPRVRTGAHTWNDPFRWQRQAEQEDTRPFVFCASLADIFDNQVPPEWRADAFDVMRRTPRLVYLLLTKRPQNIVKLSALAGGLPVNVAIGTTVEDQMRANLNVPALLSAKKALCPLFAFVSCEPLLGPINLDDIEVPFQSFSALYCDEDEGDCGSEPWGTETIDWVIAGGETDQIGHTARPTHPDWFRSLRDQCYAARVPFHFKQWGNWAEEENVPNARETYQADLAAGHTYRFTGVPMRHVSKTVSGRMLDGVEHDAFPIFEEVVL